MDNIVDVIKEKFESLVIEENNEEIQLDLKKFNKEKKVIKSRLLLYTISRLFGNTKGIEKIHIEDLIRLCENNIGNKYLTPNKNLKVLIKNHKIYLKKQNYLSYLVKSINVNKHIIRIINIKINILMFSGEKTL